LHLPYCKDTKHFLSDGQQQFLEGSMEIALAAASSDNIRLTGAPRAINKESSQTSKSRGRGRHVAG